MAAPISLHGALGHFYTPDEALEAARKVRESGFTHFDFLTPFPVHGLDEAMGLKRSWVPIVTFILAWTGIALAQGFMNYVMVLDWPLIFGGKPFFAWPSFVPVTFESMVFFGAIGTAIVALVAGKRDTVPQPPPLQIETGATIDRFVLWISATDPAWAPERALELMATLGADGARVVDARDQEVAHA